MQTFKQFERFMTVVLCILGLAAIIALVDLCKEQGIAVLLDLAKAIGIFLGIFLFCFFGAWLDHKLNPKRSNNDA